MRVSCYNRKEQNTEERKRDVVKAMLSAVISWRLEALVSRAWKRIG